MVPLVQPLVSPSVNEEVPASDDIDTLPSVWTNVRRLPVGTVGHVNPKDSIDAADKIGSRSQNSG